MRSVRMLLLIMLLIIMGSGVVSAQSGPGCPGKTRATGTLIRIDTTRGKSGDTVLVPIIVQNPDKIVGASFVVQFDTTKLRPVPSLLDSNFFDPIPGPRLKLTKTTGSTISMNYFTPSLTGLPARNILNFELLPPIPSGTGDTLTHPDTVAVSTTGDPLFYIPMVVQPGLRHLVDTGLFSFYDEQACSYVNNGGIIDVVCDTSTCRGTNWSAVILFGGNPIDVSIYPIEASGRMFFVTDTNPIGPTLVFTASATTVSSGTTVTLSYTTTNADSVVVTCPNCSITRIGKSTSTGTNTSQVIPTAPSSKYFATAYKGAQTKVDSVTITVTGGGGGGTGNPPVVSAPQQVYTINEAQTVAFTVTATDPDAGDIVTLGASSLPTNATFGPTNPRVGSSPVTGNFSFTPTVGQKGTYPIVFSGSDNHGNTTTYVVTVIVAALQFDRLFSTSAPGQSPVGGLRGTPGVAFPVNLISAQTVYGVQFDMTYPHTIIRIDSIKPSSRIPEYAVYDNLGATPGNIRVVTFGLNNEQVKTDTTTAILYLFCTIDSSAVPWSNPWMVMANGRESVTPDPSKPSLPLVTDSGMIQIDNRGDVNLDQIIDVADVVNIVAYIIGNFGLTPRQFATADIITNDTVDVFDLVGDINLIYGIPVAPAPIAPPGPQATVSLAYSDLYNGQSDVMKVNSELPTDIAGVQLEVTYDPKSVTLGKPAPTQAYKNFVLQYRDNGLGRMKILLYHGAGGAANSADLIQAGSADLVDIPITARKTVTNTNKAQIRLSQALLSTPAAASVSVKGVDQSLPTSFMLKQNYPNPFNPTTKIEFSVTAADGGGAKNVSLDIYNVLGQKVKTLVNTKMSVGDYTVEWDATTDTGSRVSSGVYLYRLQVDTQSQTRKMMFLK